MELEQIVGVTQRGDGFGDGPVGVARENALVTTHAHGRFYEMAARQKAFSLVLSAITTGVAAGNIIGAAAAASTQFALLNPAGSGKNLVLMKFGMGVISGTPGAGPLFHGYIPNIQTITAASPGGTVRGNLMGIPGNSVAIPWALAAGSALTGGQAPVTFRLADFSATGTAQAIANGHVRAIEVIDGDLIVPPGYGWLPLWSAAGTALLCGYSISWEEVAI